MDWLTRASAALLAYGDSAALCGPSAAVIHDLAPIPPGLTSVGTSADPPIHVVVPRHVVVVRQSGTVVVRSDVPRVMERWPRRTAYDCTVVDRLAASGADEVTTLIAAALRSRRTTADRLAAELARRSRFPRRAIIAGILADAVAWTESVLEQRFLRRVLVAHGLPRGVAQWPAAALRQPGERAIGDRRRFDRSIPDYRMLFELDGEVFHQGARRGADRRKANVVTRAGWVLLRYGWDECVGGACETAAEIAAELTARGWRGRARPCGPACPLARRDDSVKPYARQGVHRASR